MAIGFVNPFEDFGMYQSNSLRSSLSDQMGNARKYYEDRIRDEVAEMKAKARQEAALSNPVPNPEPNKVLLLLGENE